MPRLYASETVPFPALLFAGDYSVLIQGACLAPKVDHAEPMLLHPTSVAHGIVMTKAKV